MKLVYELQILFDTMAIGKQSIWTPVGVLEAVLGN